MHLEERRIASPSGLLMARACSRPTQTRLRRSDQSLSPAASCYRSRFVVAGKEERKVCRSQADSTLTLAKDESLLES